MFNFVFPSERRRLCLASHSNRLCDWLCLYSNLNQKRWVAVLSQEYPTLAFHASLTNSFGKGSLIQLLRQFGKVRAGRMLPKAITDPIIVSSTSCLIVPSFASHWLWNRAFSNARQGTGLYKTNVYKSKHNSIFVILFHLHLSVNFRKWGVTSPR